MSTKPAITCVDGNIFAIIGAVQSALRRAKQLAEMESFQKETEAAMEGGETDYHGMLRICMKYADFNLSDEEEEEEECEDEEEEEDSDE